MIKIKKWNDPVEASDGLRLLISRYRPGGVKNGEETWDEWCRELAPSKELLADWYGKREKKIRWSDYCYRFVEEMQRPSAAAAIDELVEAHKRGEAITLLCHCPDDTRCHRSLVRNMVVYQERWIELAGGIDLQAVCSIIPSVGGSYVLEFDLAKEVTMYPGRKKPGRKKRLGRVCLRPGRVRYYGSAFGSGGLQARVGRHLGDDKVLFWHIDWLTVREPVARVMITCRQTECGLLERDLESGRWELATQKPFGRTDCKRRPKCKAHLLVEVSSC